MMTTMMCGEADEAAGDSYELTRPLIAVHEAGHAVMMLLFDHPFTFITIRPNGNALGAVHVERGAPVPESLRRPTFPYERMIVYCAGMIAMRKQQGYDILNTMEIIAFSDPTTDGVEFRRLMKPLRAATEDADLIIRATTVSLLMQSDIWRAVEIVRDLLLARTVVSYDEATAAVGDLLTSAAIRQGTSDVLASVDEEIRAAIGAKVFALQEVQ